MRKTIIALVLLVAGVAVAQPAVGITKQSPIVGAGKVGDPLRFEKCPVGQTWISTDASGLGAYGCAVAGGVSDGDKGDVTVSGGGATFTIDSSVVTLAKMANVATNVILGRITAGSGAPEALTPAQVASMLPVATTSAKGLAPTLPNDATKFLDGTGNYTTPSGSGGDVTDVNVAATSPITSSSPTCSSGACSTTISTSMATNSIVGRVTASTGVMEILTPTQVTAMLNLATTSVKGLLRTLDNNALHYMDGTGNWSTPVGTVYNNGTGLALSTNTFSVSIAGASCSAGAHMNSLSATGTGGCSADSTPTPTVTTVSTGTTQTNYAIPSTTNIVRVVPSANIDFTGVVASTDGREFVIQNADLTGSFNVTLRHAQTSSSANQFSLPDQVDSWRLQSGCSARFYYSASATKNIMIGYACNYFPKLASSTFVTSSSGTTFTNDVTISTGSDLSAGRSSTFCNGGCTNTSSITTTNTTLNAGGATGVLNVGTAATGGINVGTSTNALAVASASTFARKVVTNGGKLTDTGTVPTVASGCGTSASVTGGSWAFNIHVGTGSVTTCDVAGLTFNSSAPTCQVNGSKRSRFYISVLGATAMTIANEAATNLASDDIYVTCVDH